MNQILNYQNKITNIESSLLEIEAFKHENESGYIFVNNTNLEISLLLQNFNDQNSAETESFCINLKDFSKIHYFSEGEIIKIKTQQLNSISIPKTSKIPKSSIILFTLVTHQMKKINNLKINKPGFHMKILIPENEEIQIRNKHKDKKKINEEIMKIGIPLLIRIYIIGSTKVISLDRKSVV